MSPRNEHPANTYLCGMDRACSEPRHRCRDDCVRPVGDLPSCDHHVGHDLTSTCPGPQISHARDHGRGVLFRGFVRGSDRGFDRGFDLCYDLCRD
eukprot:4581585-Pleurochrysis_carterae.AAC.3